MADLQAHKRNEALAAISRTASSLPAHYDLMVDNRVLAHCTRALTVLFVFED